MNRGNADENLFEFDNIARKLDIEKLKMENND